MNNHWSRVQIGVVYYPEHWDPTMWEDDVKRMQATGVKVVRLAEFAWSRMEPAEGRFSFEWLDDAIALFHQYGIQVVLCTPTNTPPRWLTDLRPDILPIQANGMPNYAGVRGHRCYNSPSLQEFGSRIINEMTKRYGKHPAVIGWQTDNEYWVIDCHCDTCSHEFRSWAKQKYRTIDRLNEEWGTVVWSGEYGDWSEVTVPLGGSRYQNPSYLLDFTRFQWDAIVKFQRSQIDIIRRNCPGHFVTHNFHTYPQRLNLHQVGADLDFASFDYYPNPSPDKQATAPYSGALSLDVTRGIKRRNFWIMEQFSGSPGGWFPTWRAPYPGFIRAYAWQAIAKGADQVLHFRWRSAAIGAEQFWHGLIDPSNVPGRRFAEFTELCREVNDLADKLEGTTVVHKAAILMSHENMEAMRIQHQAEGLNYYENVKDYHRVLTKLGIGCDVIACGQPLDGYKLVIAPSLYLMNEEMAATLEQYAASGGTLIITMRSGVKEMNNHHVTSMLPGLLANCTGVHVVEYDAIGHDAHRFVDQHGQTYHSTQWCDIVNLQDAEAIAWYEDDFYRGKPAVTVNAFGSGKVYYVATHPEEAYIRTLVSSIAEEQRIAYEPDLPEGVQLAERRDESGVYLFVMNLSREPKNVPLRGAYHSILYDVERSISLELEPYGLDILTDKTL